MEDRNKTDLTHDVTKAVATWLDERGFKPVETEVEVAAAYTHVDIGGVVPPGEYKAWIADLAGVIVPTMTELIDLKLLRRRPHWNPSKASDRVAWKAELAALDHVMTALVEVKTSRSDFIGDRKWQLPLPTDLAFVAVPSGMIKPEEWPEGWGILSYLENGTIRQLRPPRPNPIGVHDRLSTILAVAVRRDHHTRYARLREWQKQERLEAGERKTLRRVSDITRAVLQIVRGEHGSVDAVLERNRIKNIGGYAKEQLNTLWGVAPQVEDPSYAGVSSSARRARIKALAQVTNPYSPRVDASSTPAIAEVPQDGTTKEAV